MTLGRSLRIGRRKLIAAALSAVVIVVAAAAWSLGGTDLLLAVVLGTVLLGAGMVAHMVAQSERRLRADMVREIKRASRESVSRSVAELSTKIERPSEHAEALLRAVKAAHTRLSLEQEQRIRDQTAALEAISKSQISELFRKADRKVVRLFKHSPSEIDALLQIHRRLRMKDPLPLMGGWALSPRGLLQAIDLANLPEVSLVVECGSGTSTLFLARTLELNGGDRKLIALEHLPEFVESAQHALKQHGLDHIGEVRYAPLQKLDLEGVSYMWYATASIADLNDIDLLVVDGPPGSTGSLARYPAYPLLRDKLTPSAVILVDDLQRSDERSMVDAWLELGGLIESRALSDDQAILRVDPGSSGSSET